MPPSAPEIIMVPPSDLRPHPRNSRVHPAAQVQQVMAAIQEFGFTIPVLVTANNVIIAGHCRTQAAEKLGLKQIPCIRAVGWTEQQIRAYIVADNKLTENATWDYAMLGEELQFLSRADYDVALTGMGADDIARLMAGDTAYAPVLNPTAANRNITDSDMARAEASMERTRREAAEQTLVTCTCPACGHDFRVDPRSL